jgi:hypothetical protein
MYGLWVFFNCSDLQCCHPIRNDVQLPFERFHLFSSICELKILAVIKHSNDLFLILAGILMDFCRIVLIRTKELTECLRALSTS